ncbi:MAG: hypothetical protein E7036_04990 [Opitutales bacterium]|nr:hypothetical protein [Opitutales bacterium]
MKKLLIFSTLLLLTMLIGCKEVKHEYTVQKCGEIPFLHVDGKPVRSRMFYSNVPGTKFQNVDKQEQVYNIDFTSHIDSKDATVSLNFSALVKDIWIADLTLENLDDKTKKSLYDFTSNPVDKNLFSNWIIKELVTWQDYFLDFSNKSPDAKKYSDKPYKAKNENGVLHIDKAFVNKHAGIDDIERLNFCIKDIKIEKGKRYRIVAKARANTKGRFEVKVYDTKSREIIATNTQETFMTTEKYASQVGVDFITFGVPAFWKDDAICKKLVDSRFQPVIKANPNAKIIVRLGLEPPKEWLDANPSEVMQNADGTPIIRYHVRYPFPGSEVYRRDAMKAMKKFIKYVEEKYPENIAGYHPSGGNSSEWFYGGTFVPKTFNGFSPSIQKAWKKWLKEKYQTDEALQKAWQNPNVKIADVKVPSEKERRNAHAPLINPENSSHVVDFNLFLQDAMCDTILLAAKTIRETAPKGRLSVVFYGYGNVFVNAKKGPAYSGHYAFRKVLDSPDIDILTSPIAYFDREFGGLKCTQAPTETSALYGKLWLEEDDNRTWLAPESGSPPFVMDFKQTNRESSKKVLRRNMIQQTLKNLGSWWMDLFGCGWYLDRELWDVMDEFKEIENEFINKPSPYIPDIALTYDEVSLCYCAGEPHNLLTVVKTIIDLPRQIMKNGATLGYYMFEDILDGKITPKLHYVSAGFALNGKQRKLLRESENRMTNVYMWNVGYIDKDNRRFSLESIKDATGFDVEYAGIKKALAYPTEEGKKLGMDKCGINKDIELLFSPKIQSGDIVLANYQNGKPAIVVRKTGKYPQIFCGLTSINKNTTACFARIAGVHSYVDNDAVVTTNANYIGFHTIKDAKHTLLLKEEADVYDVLEKKNLGRFKTKVFDLKKGDVKLLRLSK